MPASRSGAVDDLWGPLPIIEDPTIPPSILRQQADILANRTGGLLLGEVRTFEYGDALATELKVIAPKLDNYAVSVVRAVHPPTMYPAHLENLLAADSEAILCNTREQFTASLRQILQSKSVNSVITSLLSMSAT